MPDIVVTRGSQFGEAMRQAELERRAVIIETGWRTFFLRCMIRLMYRLGMFANKP